VTVVDVFRNGRVAVSSLNGTPHLAHKPGLVTGITLEATTTAASPLPASSL
jgi:hypothetical protein